MRIGGNRRGREITQEVMKAVPRGNNERLNRIRNNGDEEEDMDLSDINGRKRLELVTDG